MNHNVYMDVHFNLKSVGLSANIKKEALFHQNWYFYEYGKYSPVIAKARLHTHLISIKT